jgi:hypothetical protein
MVPVKQVLIFKIILDIIGCRLDDITAQKAQHVRRQSKQGILPTVVAERHY